MGGVKKDRSSGARGEAIIGNCDWIRGGSR